MTLFKGFEESKAPAKSHRRSGSTGSSITSTSNSTSNSDITGSSNSGTTTTTRTKWFPLTALRGRPHGSKVHFAVEQPTVYIIVDHVQPEEEAIVWYSMDYLQAARREEIKNNLRAQHHKNNYNDDGNGTITKKQFFSSPNSSRSSIMDDESNEVFCRRGLEDVLEEGCSRNGKISAHVRAVLRKQHSLMAQPWRLPTSPRHMERQLGHFAASRSKADRSNAIRRAQEDETFVTLVQGIKTRKTTTSSRVLLFGRGHQQQYLNANPWGTGALAPLLSWH